MSQSKRRAMGQSYYFDAVNKRGQKYLRACSACGQRGFDPAALENEPNQHLLAELRHLYNPLPLNPAGLCEICITQLSNSRNST